jgi:hypothetical protein
MRIKIFFIVVGMGFIAFASAQQLSPTVIAPQGSFDQTPTMSLEWTVGEIAIETLHYRSKMYSEGFHQPVLHVKKINPQIEFRILEDSRISNSDDYEISVTPNPVRSILHVRIESKDRSDIYLSLSDLAGRTLFNTVVDPLVVSKDLDLSYFAAGLYLLKFSNNEGDLIQTYKISKIQ